jgi:hypothetical protein
MAGAGNGSGAGGITTISGGPPGATGLGGGLVLTGASGGSTSGSGGSASLIGGSGTAGNASGGPVAISGGAGQGSGSGASVTLSGGIAGSASGLGGEIIFRSAAAPAATTLFERFRVTNDGALNATGIASASEPTDPSATDGRLYFNSDRENFRTAALAGGTGAGYQDLFRWVKVTKAYTDFSVAAPTSSITGYALPAGAVIHAVKIYPTTSFTGGGLTSYRIEVGVSGVLNKYASSFLVSGAVSGTNFQVTSVVGSENQLASTPILFTATGTGANLDQATQGSVDIYILVSDAGF